MIEQLHEIEREPLVRERVLRTGLRFAMPADVGTHDAEVSREMRHPAEEPQRAAETGVQQQGERRFFPRIGEVVVAVVKLRAVAGSPVRGVRHLGGDRGSAEARTIILGGKRARRLMKADTKTAIVLAALAALAFVSSANVHAAERAAAYPSKPIRLIVPFSPGGSADNL